MELFLAILRDYGIGAMGLAVIVYIIIKGEIDFHYPRPKGKGTSTEDG